jgi:hypothetical protein
MAKPGLDGQKLRREAWGAGRAGMRQKNPKRVKAAQCKRSQGQGKDIVPYPGRPAERQKSAEAIVVDGVTNIQGGQGNLATGRRAERLRS